MSALTGAAVAEALIASTLLMGLVLLVRKPAQRSIGPQLAYWLWALPVLRLVLPPLPAEWRESAAAPISAASETVLVYLAPAVATTGPAEAGMPWLLLAAAGWGIGALLFFAWHGAAHFAYVRRILAPPARQRRLADGTTLVESDEAIGPVAFGVLRRFVAVPRDFAERYEEDERRLALAHELGHHQRGDLVANWIALGVLAVHWFNPIAWVAYRKFRCDQEMANDARVLAALPPVERHAYACAILKAAHGRAVTAACHLHTIEDLKGRLRMLKANRKSRRVLLVGATGVLVTTVVGLGLTASSAAAEKIRTAAAVQVPLLAAQVAPPAAPIPPAAPAAPLETRKRITIVRDGKAETYEGAEADAMLARDDKLAAAIDAADAVRRHRIVIRNKDGKVERYEGAAADNFLKAHPEMRAPRPPLPPLPAIGAAPPAPPAPFVPGTIVLDGKGDKRAIIVRNGPGARAWGFAPSVIERDCKGKGGFTSSDRKDGKQRMIICTNRIEAFAAGRAKWAEGQARLAESQARLGQLHARMGLTQALRGLDTGRAAIENNRNLSDEAKKQALAGIESARIEIEREMREGKAD